MALKGDRNILETDVTKVCNSVVNAGAVLVLATGAGLVASGAGLYTRAQAELVTNPSGRVPVGITLSSFVNIDQTRQKRNFQKMESVIGEPANLLKKGMVVTDQVVPGVTITGGDTAYCGPTGLLTNVNISGYPKVGQFDSAKDQDGFAKVNVNLPIV